MFAPERAVGIRGGGLARVGRRPSDDEAGCSRPAGACPRRHRGRAVATLAVILVCLLTAASSLARASDDPTCTIAGYAAGVRSEAARAAAAFADGERHALKDLEISVAARSGARRAGDLASSRFADDIDAEYRLANLFRTKRHIEEMIQENANIIEKMYHEASRIFDGKGAPDGRDGDYVYS